MISIAHVCRESVGGGPTFRSLNGGARGGAKFISSPRGQRVRQVVGHKQVCAFWTLNTANYKPRFRVSTERYVDRNKVWLPIDIQSGQRQFRFLVRSEPLLVLGGHQRKQFFR